MGQLPPQAFWARCRGQRLPVPQPPIGEGLCQPDPPRLASTLLIYHMMISVVVVMTTSTSLIYCLTVSSVFWPDICYIIISADSKTPLFWLQYVPSLTPLND